jgi:outer membrane protein assembly factor BamB
MSKRLLLALGAAVVVLAAGAVTAWLVVLSPSEPSGSIDTDLKGVTTLQPKKTVPVPREPPPPVEVAHEGPCWEEFGGNPQRSLSRVRIHLGKPTKPLWARALGGYIEYPPSYCDGRLYVNTFRGRTAAFDARTGKVIWSRSDRGAKHSTPAIAGPRLIVSSKNGTVTGLARATGERLWQLRTSAKIESSPVAIGNTVYFGATDGRLFAVNASSGAVRWAYDTGGRINASPSIWGNRICISTYAGSLFCLDRRDGRKLWNRYFNRGFFRNESFYASPSTDGRRIFLVSRSGKVYAVDARNGEELWTGYVGSPGYTTPAVAAGRVIVGGFDGALRAYSAATGRELWRRYVPGRILGGAVIVGNLVFFSTLETNTYAARVDNGRIVWKIGLGKYSPGIATDRHYYFSLNGMLVAFRGQNSPPEPKVTADGVGGAKAGTGGRRARKRSKP